MDYIYTICLRRNKAFLIYLRDLIVTVDMKIILECKLL